MRIGERNRKEKRGDGEWYWINKKRGIKRKGGGIRKNTV